MRSNIEGELNSYGGGSPSFVSRKVLMIYSVNIKICI